MFNAIQRSRRESASSWVQTQVRTFDYFYGLRLGILLLRYIDNLSALLQAKELCAAESQTIANILFLQLRRRRRTKLPSILGGCETENNKFRCR